MIPRKTKVAAFLLPMLLNPLVNLLLAAVSLVIGTVALINTDNWLVMLPCLIFMLLFTLSLFRPVPTKVFVPSLRTESRPQRPLVKLTASRLRIISASRSPFAANQSGAHDLSHTSA